MTPEEQYDKAYAIADVIISTAKEIAELLPKAFPKGRYIFKKQNRKLVRKRRQERKLANTRLNITPVFRALEIARIKSTPIPKFPKN